MRQMIDEAKRMLLARRTALLRKSSWSSDTSRSSSLEAVELNEIDAALERIENGSFGHCQQCGCSIGRLRLRALPETRYCVGCATAGRREARNRNSA